MERVWRAHDTEAWRHVHDLGRSAEQQPRWVVDPNIRVGIVYRIDQIVVRTLGLAGRRRVLWSDFATIGRMQVGINAGNDARCLVGSAA